eukprot:1087916-Rhodomonas_salina.1
MSGTDLAYAATHTGVHQLQALLLASSHSTDADPQVVSSYFHVYEQWLHAFEAPTLPTAQYHTKLLQVSGPRYRLPSHHYNFLPYQVRVGPRFVVRVGHILVVQQRCTEGACVIPMWYAYSIPHTVAQYQGSVRQYQCGTRAGSSTTSTNVLLLLVQQQSTENMVQATGMGLLWPGITVRRPVPAEVFGSDEEVVLEIELLDYSDTD